LWGYFVLSLPILWVVAVVLWLVTFPFDHRRRILHMFTCWWGSHYAHLVPTWRIVVEGRHNIDPDKTYVLTPNHQSAVDILVLFALHRHFKWVSKREAFKLPFIGWNMWMNDYVGLRRGERRSIARMMDECRRHLRNGSSIMIFPEGTRSLDGKLRKFRHGAFTLACEAGVPIVPIVMEGTFEALPKHGFLLRSKGSGRAPIWMRVLEPISPSEVGGDRDVLMARVRARLAAEIASLRGVTVEDVA
jgi:1-acyl-sn-glycerol-3-phosphate acyltransferase